MSVRVACILRACRVLFVVLVFALPVLPVALPARADTVRLAVTTSLDNSGLTKVLMREIAADTGIRMQIVVAGTGQALRLGERGDVDAVIVHARALEEAFVAAGHALGRVPIMWNDFVLVGPGDDPAGVRGQAGAAQALAAIAVAGAPFVSRGDDSGTHTREMALWGQAGRVPEGAWYRAVGAGMGAALNIAAGMNAYVLTDRATWLTFGNKAGMEILLEGDPALFNQYSFLPVNPHRHPHVKAAAILRLRDWLVSDRARTVIDGYTLGGQTLFTWNARPVPGLW